MARQYKSGSKRTYAGIGEGVRSQNRVAWLKSVLGEVVLLRFSQEEVEGKKEPGPTYRIQFNKSGSRLPYIMTLTSMTSDELEALKEFAILTYSAILPIIEDRDRNADEAATRGDDSFDRVYRPLPQVVVRERTFSEDNQSLHDRLANVLKRPWVRSMRDVGARGNGNDLADDESKSSRAQDDGPKADESP